MPSRAEKIFQAAGKRRRQVFTAAGPLVFLTFHILEQLSRTNTRNEHVVVLTNRFPKLIREIPPTKMTSTQKRSYYCTIG